MQFCIDYWRLNQVTKVDAYPLPHIEDSLNTLEGAQFFCSLDLASCYWQVEMDTADREKTAFVTHGRLYEFRVMPFGLVNARTRRPIQASDRGAQTPTLMRPAGAGTPGGMPAARRPRRKRGWPNFDPADGESGRRRGDEDPAAKAVKGGVVLLRTPGQVGGIHVAVRER